MPILNYTTTVQAECTHCSELARHGVEEMLDLMRDAIERSCREAVAKEGAALIFEKVVTDSGDENVVLSQPYLGREDFGFLERQLDRLGAEITGGRHMEAAMSMFELRQWLASKRAEPEGEAP